jgi:hypothetical protein
MSERGGKRVCGFEKVHQDLEKEKNCFAVLRLSRGSSDPEEENIASGNSQSTVKT